VLGKDWTVDGDGILYAITGIPDMGYSLFTFFFFFFFAPSLGVFGLGAMLV
jgi:hypothetical protein